MAAPVIAILVDLSSRTKFLSRASAIGVDTEGYKHVLGLRDGASENQIVCKALLEDLVERGLSPVPSIYSSARPELDRSPVSRDHACMISSFVRARPLARPQTQTLSC